MSKCVEIEVILRGRQRTLHFSLGQYGLHFGCHGRPNIFSPGDDDVTMNSCLMFPPIRFVAATQEARLLIIVSERMVCRKDMASNTTHLVIWEWEFSYGLWLPYEPEAVLLIENARRSNRKRIKLNGRLASYEVDLRTETQIRTDTGKPDDDPETDMQRRSVVATHNPSSKSQHYWHFIWEFITQTFWLFFPQVPLPRSG